MFNSVKRIKKAVKQLLNIFDITKNISINGSGTI